SALPGLRERPDAAESGWHRPAGRSGRRGRPIVRPRARSRRRCAMTSPLHGIVAYPLTPFTARDRVDEARLGELVDAMVDAGVHAIAPLGSTGVLPYLSDDERALVAETVVKRVAGRVPTLVGVSSL